jgi:hypothetical protein
MIRSVNKHSYVKGRNGKARARGHVNYIAHREGGDREQGGRKFFDRDRDDIAVREVRDLVDERADERGVTIHKLILSPGMQEVELKEYTRELMEKLEREKGMQLDWKAVIHDNTDHKHAHVVILGLDKEGHRVRFDRKDHKLLRELGDGYLDREHKLERYLDREISDLLRARDYDRGGDDRFKQLVYGADLNNLDRQREKDIDRTRDDEDKKRSRDHERDRQEFDQFDKDMRRGLQEADQGIGLRTGRKQRVREQQGRLSDFHGDYSDAMAKQKLERMAEEYPEMKEEISREIEFMHQLSREDRTGSKGDPELDRLLAGDPMQRENRQERQSWKTFESDRQAKDHHELERDKEERQRGDEFDRGGGR